MNEHVIGKHKLTIVSYIINDIEWCAYQIMYISAMLSEAKLLFATFKRVFILYVLSLFACFANIKFVFVNWWTAIFFCRTRVIYDIILEKWRKIFNKIRLKIKFFLSYFISSQSAL